MNKYQSKVPLKTRLYNLLRRFFRLRFLENKLMKLTDEKNNSHLVRKLIPPNYLYPKGSYRTFDKGGIKLNLDISNEIDHGLYFNYKDAGQEKLFELVKSDMVIIDVGVNIGTTILKFAKYAENGKVIGFEPDIEMYAKAKKNIALNNFKNILLIDKGLGNETMRLKLYRVHENNPGMNRILDSGQIDCNYDFTEIEVIKLDDFTRDNNIEKIDLIKIDVEGYEFNVIQGGIEVLKKMRPIFFVELVDRNLRENNTSEEQLVRFFENYNYQVFRADNNMPVTSKDNLNACHYDIICHRTII